MSWHIEVQASGLFVVATEVGKPILEGVFKPGIPEDARMRVLHQIAEVPDMVNTLTVVKTFLDSMGDELIKANGEGAAGQLQARQQAPKLFAVADAVSDQLLALTEKTA